jgi:hypothetical protein
LSRGEPPALSGSIRQIGYVVHDFDQAVAGWLNLGVGPWYVLRSLPQPGTYRGEPCTVTLSTVSSREDSP